MVTEGRRRDNTYPKPFENNRTAEGGTPARMIHDSAPMFQFFGSLP